MPYELLLQGRKLNKREMGEGVLTRVEGKGVVGKHSEEK